MVLIKSKSGIIPNVFIDNHHVEQSDCVKFSLIVAWLGKNIAVMFRPN